jgi:hypothetical protein
MSLRTVLRAGGKIALVSGLVVNLVLILSPVRGADGS